MSLKTRLAARIIWVLVGIMATIGGISLTIAGFNGTLPPAYAGIGWLFVSIQILFMAFGDVIKLVGAMLDLADGGK